MSLNSYLPAAAVCYVEIWLFICSEENNLCGLIWTLKATWDPSNTDVHNPNYNRLHSLDEEEETAFALIDLNQIFNISETKQPQLSHPLAPLNKKTPTY